jgi:hypothetical protein
MSAFLQRLTNRSTRTLPLRVIVRTTATASAAPVNSSRSAREEMARRLDPKSMEESQVWYLLLLFGVPFPTFGEDPRDHFRTVREECEAVGVKVRRLFVHSDQSSQGRDTNGRYLFRFLRYKRDDQAAVRLAESFLYGLSLVHGPMTEPHHDSLVLRVPDSMVRERDEVLLDKLVKLEESRDPEDRALSFPCSTIGQLSMTTPDRFEAAWRIARVTFADEHLFEATRFLERSHENFYVYPGQIRQVASDPEMVPITSAHQTDFEDALQNAFKAVEAIIGDPPKDERKFFLKLRQIGLDPQEEVGYRTKTPLHQVIRDMNRERDKKSAHGSTRDRTIKAAELLDYQECSRCVVMAAIEAARGSSVFC